MPAPKRPRHRLIGRLISLVRDGTEHRQRQIVGAAYAEFPVRRLFTCAAGTRPIRRVQQSSVAT